MSDPDSLAEEGRAPLGMQLQALFRNYENVFYQWRKGAITDQVWQGSSHPMRSVFRMPGPQRWWPTWHENCQPEFRALRSSWVR